MKVECQKRPFSELRRSRRRFDCLIFSVKFFTYPLPPTFFTAVRAPALKNYIATEDRPPIDFNIPRLIEAKYDQKT